MSELLLSSRVVGWLASRLLPPIEEVGHHAARAQMRSMVARLGRLEREIPVASLHEQRIEGVPVRRYEPTRQKRGTIAYFHGGGWVLGDLDTHDAVCRALARASEREVVAVDYRRAPEHPYPAAIDDAWAVTRALAGGGAPLVVAGDSAGGHLAAVVARRAAREGLALAGQLLVYPVTDCSRESPSYARYATGHFLLRSSMRYFIETFIPDANQRRDPEASPLHAPASPTAPAYVLLARADVLHDEGVAYADKLRDEGTPVVLDDVPGVLHGFLSAQGLAPGRDALARAAAWVAGRMDAAAAPRAS